jgi:cAMP-specific phosphodiesterase 4
MALKVADLGHNSAPLAVNIKWVDVLEEEMFQQGDKEKEQGLPVSPLCDREKSGVTSAQV